LQDAEIQKRLQEERALVEISRALSKTERGGLGEVLHLIVSSAKELNPAAEQAVIHLLDIEHDFLIPRAVIGFQEPQNEKLNMRLGEGVAGQVIANGMVVNIGDVSRDSRFLQMENPPRFRSLLVCPIQSGEVRLGTISVQSGRANAFSTDEQRLLSLLGAEAAIAIENARLLEVTQEGLKEVNALYRATQKLASSLDPVELMGDVVDHLQENFGYYQVQIYLLEEGTGDLVISKGTGEIGASLMARKHRIPAGKGITGHVITTGQPFLTNDVENTPYYIANPILPNTRSELCVPIKINGRAVGVLNVERDSNSRWLTERDLQLVGAVGEQLSVSLQKAELYAHLQTSLQEEKRMRSQLVQNERLAVVGRLLASVSHELNNPLQAIQNALFLLKEERGISAQGRQDLNIILSEAERMSGLIERLRSTYRPAQAADFQAIQINSLLEAIHALLATHLRHNQIAFEFHPDPDLPAITGLPDQLKQVALNLVMNAVEAMPSGGRLKVVTSRETNDEICFSISDTGPGINPAILSSIFDPFVTSKETGTGLGLTICYDIIQRHNGRIVAENSPETGAVFTVWLPIRK
jgi:signal transduction histidine kinase